MPFSNFVKNNIWTKSFKINNFVSNSEINWKTNTYSYLKQTDKITLDIPYSYLCSMLHCYKLNFRIHHCISLRL